MPVSPIIGLSKCESQPLLSCLGRWQKSHHELHFLRSSSKLTCPSQYAKHFRCTACWCNCLRRVRRTIVMPVYTVLTWMPRPVYSVWQRCKHGSTFENLRETVPSQKYSYVTLLMLFAIPSYMLRLSTLRSQLYGGHKFQASVRCPVFWRNSRYRCSELLRSSFLVQTSYHFLVSNWGNPTVLEHNYWYVFPRSIS